MIYMMRMALLIVFGTQLFIDTNGYPYIFEPTKKPWQESKSYCVSIGAVFPVPSSTTKNEEIRAACAAGGAVTCWVNVEKNNYDQWIYGTGGLAANLFCPGENDGGTVVFIDSSRGCWGDHWNDANHQHATVCDPIPTVSPTPAPTINPTLSPTLTCEGRGLIKHINWDDLFNSNNMTKANNEKPDTVINAYIDPISLYLTINVELDYLGSSYAELNNVIIEVGTTYIIDFKSFDGNTDSIDEPGNCQNRLASSFILVNKMDWWTYSELPYGPNQLGTDNYLAYPPLPNQWSIQSKYAETCQPILYSGYFSLDDLVSCTDYNGNKLYEIQESSTEITLKWTLNIDVVSPRINSNDNNIYRVYPLDKHDILMTFTKSNELLSSSQTQQVFFITVDSLSIIGKVINIIFYTESADYIFLKNPILISSPLGFIFQHSITSLTSTNCIVSTSYTCGQRWKLEITNFEDQCPVIDLKGNYMIKFDANCDNTTSVCNEFISNNNGSDVLLISYLNYMNTLCDVSSIDVSIYTEQEFYIENGFNQQQQIYGIGYPIYVEIISQIVNHSSAAQIFNILAVEINNVYVCSPLQSNNIITSCLNSNIDPNGPYHIISNGVPNSNYGATIIKSGIDNYVQFEFNIFETGSEKIYIHSQILLTIQTGHGSTRRILVDNTQFNTFQYNVKSTSITKLDATDNNNGNDDNYNYIMIVIVGGIVLFILIIFILVIFKLNSKNKKLKQQIENQVNDQVNGTETKYVE